MSTDLKVIGDVRAQIARAAEVYPVKAASMLIVDDETFAIAKAMLEEVHGYLKAWNEWMDPQIEGAMETKRVAEKNRKKLCDDKDLRAGPLKKAQDTLVILCDTYSTEQEALRQVEIARLEAALTAEAAEKTLEDAVALEEQALTAPSLEERDELLAEVETVLSLPVPAPRHVEAMVPMAPTVPGLSRPETWAWQTDDLTVLLKALIEKKLDKVLVKELTDRIGEAILPPLNQRARALKAALHIPGGRAVSNKGTRMR